LDGGYTIIIIAVLALLTAVVALYIGWAAGQAATDSTATSNQAIIWAESAYAGVDYLDARINDMENKA
jgi:flagellar basal body-associated protein FliL